MTPTPTPAPDAWAPVRFLIGLGLVGSVGLFAVRLLALPVTGVPSTGGLAWFTVAVFFAVPAALLLAMQPQRSATSRLWVFTFSLLLMTGLMWMNAATVGSFSMWNWPVGAVLLASWVPLALAVWPGQTQRVMRVFGLATVLILGVASAGVMLHDAATPMRTAQGLLRAWMSTLLTLGALVWLQQAHSQGLAFERARAQISWGTLAFTTLVSLVSVGFNAYALNGSLPQMPWHFSALFVVKLALLVVARRPPVWARLHGAVVVFAGFSAVAAQSLPTAVMGAALPSLAVGVGLLVATHLRWAALLWAGLLAAVIFSPTFELNGTLMHLLASSFVAIAVGWRSWHYRLHAPGAAARAEPSPPAPVGEHRFAAAVGALVLVLGMGLLTLYHFAQGGDAQARPIALPVQLSLMLAVALLAGWFAHLWQRDQMRHSQQAVQQASFEQLENIFRVSVSGLTLADEHGKLVKMNPAASALTGIPPEAVGSWVLFSAESHPQQALKEALQTCLQTGQSNTLHWSGTNVFGQFIDAQITFSPITLGGRPHALIQLEDQRELRAQQRQLQAALTDNQAMTVALKTALVDARAGLVAQQQFWATLSHEIRTPMNAMMGMLQILAINPSLSASAKDQVDLALKNTQLLLAMFNDVLDQESLQSGRFNLTIAPMRPSGALHYLRMMSAKLSLNPAVQFEVDIDPKLNHLVLGDEVRIRQVLLHLLTNAIKFTHHGMVKVTGETERTQHHQTLVMQVLDTGIGMDEATLNKVGKPFVQGDMSDTRRYGGKGLGLVICQGLVQRMGGTMAIQSTLGLGTVVSVTLTLPLASEQELTERLSTGGKTEHENLLMAMQAVLFKESQTKANDRTPPAAS